MNRDERVRFYRDRLIPHALGPIVGLATAGQRYALERCELVFRFEIDGETRMGTHRTHKSADKLAKRLLEDAPASLELGGIFPGILPLGIERRRLDHTGLVRAPLVIDVDASDYGAQVRRGRCVCHHANQLEAARTVCATCWEHLLEPGRSALLYVLRVVCGFRHLLSVFSGRRGYHVWVLDERVLEWTSAQRARCIRAIASPSAFNPQVRKVVCSKLAPAAKFAQMDDPLALYPPLDEAVSTDATHLIKLPLVGHPATGALTFPLGAPPVRYTSGRFCGKACNVSPKRYAEATRMVREAVERAYGK